MPRFLFLDVILLFIGDCQLSITHYSLLITHYSLLITHYSLLIINYQSISVQLHLNFPFAFSPFNVNRYSTPGSRLKVFILLLTPVPRARREIWARLQVFSSPENTTSHSPFVKVST
ncbi:MAG: hypothetical protein EOO49_18960 [Flavobacterium sp.]|nr:MAG: hypothetical protein EOO49_18960 [Flavobacterium sp.]